MIEENTNGNGFERSTSICEASAKDEPRNNQRHEDARPHTKSWLLPLVHARAAGDIGQSRATPYAYATFEKTREAMKGQSKSVRYEMMYGHLLYTFEKKQIKLGLRNNLNKSDRPRQVIANKSTHKNFVTANDVRNIKPIPQKKYDQILKYINRGGEFTTTMVSNGIGLSVSDLAWTLNVMYKGKLVDRVSKRTTPIIGNPGPKSWRYVYFKKK
jgi:hypothetical protein